MVIARLLGCPGVLLTGLPGPDLKTLWIHIALPAHDGVMSHVPLYVKARLPCGTPCTSQAMAQRKPASSRATAVVACCLILPASSR